MIRSFAKFQRIDALKWAVLSLLILWVGAALAPALMQVAFVAALTFWGVAMSRDRSFLDIRGDEALWGFLAFFYFWVVLSSFTSEYPKESLRGLWKISMPVLTFLMTAYLFRPQNTQKRFMTCFVLTSIIVTIDASYQYAFGKDFIRHFSVQDSRAGLRIVGPFGDFGKMAAFLVLVIPVFVMQCWGTMKDTGLRGKGLYPLLLAIASTLLLYLTRCRGPILALVLSFFCLLIFKRWFKALGITLLLALLFLAVVPRAMIVHMNIQAKEQSVDERMCLWRRALDVIKAKPFLGTGINTYAKAHAKYDTRQQKNLMPIRGTGMQIQQNPNGSVSFIDGANVATSDAAQKAILWGGGNYNLQRDPDGEYYIYNDLLVRGYYAHNGYLQLAAEIGIPGILFFLAFLGVFFARALERVKKWGTDEEAYVQLGILTGLLAFLLYALVDTNLQSPQSLIAFWYLAGILWARQTGPITVEGFKE